jgi:hypothetical protein
MSSAKSLFGGFTTMVYCILIGIIINISLAHGLDVMLVKFGSMGMFDVPAVWDSSAVVTAVKRQEYDKYKEPNEV